MTKIFQHPPEHKKPKYVYAYEKLYAMIMDGDFALKGKLPTEPKLAQMLGISRMTLRQAIALLKDDGLISNVHGKGNFITLAQNKKNDGLEKIGNPIYKCSNKDIDSVEMDFRIEPPNEYMQKCCEKRTSAMVVINRWYRSGKAFVAYSLTFVPIETISALNIDLNNEQELLEFLQTHFYNIATNAKLEIKPSETGEFISSKYVISNKKQLHLILESLYNENSYPMLYNKHYLVMDDCNLIINLTNK